MNCYGPACHAGACGGCARRNTYGSDGYVEVKAGNSSGKELPMPATGTKPMPLQNAGTVQTVPGYENLLNPGKGPATNPNVAGDSQANQQPVPRPNRSLPPTQYSRYNPQAPANNRTTQRTTTTPGLIGPVGYDTEQ